MTRVLLISVLIAVTGCTAAPSDATCDGALWHETQLYLGRDVPGGGEVSEEAWQSFVATSVAPRLPQGFTVVDGTGFWLDEDTRVGDQEKSKIVTVLHRDDDGVRAALDAVAGDYIARFQQQAVMRAERRSCVRFYSGG